jgi:hypothetical protein
MIKGNLAIQRIKGTTKNEKYEKRGNEKDDGVGVNCVCKAKVCPVTKMNRGNAMTCVTARH